MKIVNNVLELVGNTPLIQPGNYCAKADIEGVTLLAKLDKLDGSYVKYFEKLIDKLDQMDNNQKEFFTAVLEKLDK